MPKVTRKTKPRKPRADFPLFPHQNGWWAKKVRGKLLYFGRWDDPDGALAKWLDQKDDLLANRTPRVQGEGLTVRDLCNRFLTSKRLLADAGEIKERTWRDYRDTCERVIKQFGKSRLVSDLAADDFEALRATMAKSWGPVMLGNEIQRCRVLFKYAFDSGLIEKQVRYGQAFKRPSRKAIRQARNEKGPRMFTADELTAMLGAATPQLKAMILLGINCGLGNTDIGTLPTKALDLKAGWLEFPRAKTAIPRRCKLWPETVEAIRDALANRQDHKDPADAGLVFITKRGMRWAKDTASSPLSAEMTKLLTKLGIKRPGLNFYALRHTFQTIGEGAGDAVAVSSVMGHAPGTSDMAAVYREQVADERIKAVTDYVRSWLFPPAKRAKPKPAKHVPAGHNWRVVGA
ncbi:MAG: integrase [Pirellulales bacterium]